MKRLITPLFINLLLLAGTVCLAADVPVIILATTTSTQDTGLLDVLLPSFEKETGIKVKVIAVGTGEALAMGRRGDADVLLVHSRKAEDEFMAAGFGLVRFDVMHNDFLLVGPMNDPAKAEALDALVAFQRIARSTSLFISRGDESGTHKKEKDLWQKACITPSGAWYISTGQGMGETIRVASEKGAYTLIDRGTFLAIKSTLNLRLITDGGDLLINPYGVIVVSSAKHPKVHAKEGKQFADWLVSPRVQAIIGSYGLDKFGRTLFVPAAKPVQSK